MGLPRRFDPFDGYHLAGHRRRCHPIVRIQIDGPGIIMSHVR